MVTERSVFTQAGIEIISNSGKIVLNEGGSVAGSRHLFKALLQDPEVDWLLRGLGVDMLFINRLVDSLSYPEAVRANDKGDVMLTDTYKSCLRNALITSRFETAPQIDPMHMLLGVMMTKDNYGALVLAGFGVDRQAVLDELSLMSSGNDQIVGEMVGRLRELLEGTRVSEQEKRILVKRIREDLDKLATGRINKRN